MLPRQTALSKAQYGSAVSAATLASEVPTETSEAADILRQTFVRPKGQAQITLITAMYHVLPRRKSKFTSTSSLSHFVTRPAAAPVKSTLVHRNEDPVS